MDLETKKKKIIHFHFRDNIEPSGSRCTGIKGCWSAFVGWLKKKIRKRSTRVQVTEERGKKYVETFKQNPSLFLMPL